MEQIGREGDLGRVAHMVINAKYSPSYRRRVRGDHLVAVLEFGQRDAKLARLRDVIRQAHGEWERFVDPAE